MLTTDRLILRHWEESDAENLYKYAKDPDIGAFAGWHAHKSVDESREIIKNVLSGDEAYAVCLKDDNKAIGAIELMPCKNTKLSDRDDECELGYWIAKPFWGQALIPEATREILRHAFEDMGINKVWCGYFEGNDKSKRVQEKCGFTYQYTDSDYFVVPLQEKRVINMSSLSKSDWQKLQNK